jgi:hypothetical protein
MISSGSRTSIIAVDLRRTGAEPDMRVQSSTFVQTLSLLVALAAWLFAACTFLGMFARGRLSRSSGAICHMMACCPHAATLLSSDEFSGTSVNARPNFGTVETEDFETSAMAARNVILTIGLCRFPSHLAFSKDVRDFHVCPEIRSARVAKYPRHLSIENTKATVATVNPPFQLDDQAKRRGVLRQALPLVRA